MNHSISNKTMLITGSTDGIGWQTAYDLAVMGTRVIVHGRSEEKARTAAEQITEKTGNTAVEYVSGDLASLQEISEMSKELHNRFEVIDVLINNAGVLKSDLEHSKDGFELTFAVNHLAYFYLSGLLVDLVKKSSYARIINVASQAHASSLDFDNLQAEKHYNDYDAYSRSKLCNILFSYQLAAMVANTGLTVNTLHPGVISTKLLHTGWGGGGSAWTEGSKTSVFLATAPEVAGVSGKYFSGGKPISSAAISYDKGIQERLWKESEKLTGFAWE